MIDLDKRNQLLLDGAELGEANQIIPTWDDVSSGLGGDELEALGIKYVASLESNKLFKSYPLGERESLISGINEDVESRLTGGRGVDPYDSEVLSEKHTELFYKAIERFAPHILDLSFTPTESREVRQLKLQASVQLESRMQRGRLVNQDQRELIGDIGTLVGASLAGRENTIRAFNFLRTKWGPKRLEKLLEAKDLDETDYRWFESLGLGAAEGIFIRGASGLQAVGRLLGALKPWEDKEKARSERRDYALGSSLIGESLPDNFARHLGTGVGEVFWNIGLGTIGFAVQGLAAAENTMQRMEAHEDMTGERVSGGAKLGIGVSSFVKTFLVEKYTTKLLKGGGYLRPARAGLKRWAGVAMGKGIKSVVGNFLIGASGTIAAEQLEEGVEGVIEELLTLGYKDADQRFWKDLASSPFNALNKEFVWQMIPMAVISGLFHVNAGKATNAFATTFNLESGVALKILDQAQRRGKQAGSIGYTYEIIDGIARAKNMSRSDVALEFTDDIKGSSLIDSPLASWIGLRDVKDEQEQIALQKVSRRFDAETQTRLSPVGQWTEPIVGKLTSEERATRERAGQLISEERVKESLPVLDEEVAKGKVLSIETIEEGKVKGVPSLEEAQAFLEEKLKKPGREVVSSANQILESLNDKALTEWAISIEPVNQELQKQISTQDMQGASERVRQARMARFRGEIENFVATTKINKWEGLEVVSDSEVATLLNTPQYSHLKTVVALAKHLNREVLWYRGSNYKGFGGLWDAGVIGMKLTKNAQSDVMQTTMHEILHTVERSHPKQWNELKDFLVVNYPTMFSDMKKEIELDKRGRPTAEGVSYIYQESIFSQEFMDKLTEQNPSLAKRIKSIFQQVITKVRKFLADISPGFSVEERRLIDTELTRVLESVREEGVVSKGEVVKGGDVGAQAELVPKRKGVDVKIEVSARKLLKVKKDFDFDSRFIGANGDILSAEGEQEVLMHINLASQMQGSGITSQMADADIQGKHFIKFLERSGLVRVGLNEWRGEKSSNFQIQAPLTSEQKSAILKAAQNSIQVFLDVDTPGMFGPSPKTVILFSGSRSMFNSEIRNGLDNIDRFLRKEEGWQELDSSISQLDPQVDETKTLELKQKELKLSILTQAANSLGVFVDFRTPLRNHASGKLLIELGNEVETNARLIQGPWIYKWGLLEKALKRKTRKWMDEVDDSGKSNFERMVLNPKHQSEDTEVNSQARQWVALHRSMMNSLGLRAENLRIYRRRGGRFERFRRVKKGKIVPRFITNEGIRAIEQSDSLLYETLLNKVKELNPSMTIKSISKLLKSSVIHEGPMVKRAGLLELARRIPNFPSQIINPKNGRKVEILHTSASYVVKRAIEAQARRLSVIDKFGQHLAKNPRKSSVARVLKAIDPKLVPKFSRSLLIKNLIEIGGLDEKSVFGKDLKDLKEIAGIVGVLKATSMFDNYLEVLDHVTSLTDEQIKRLKPELKKLGGISDFALNNDELLESIKERSTEVLLDIMTDLRNQYKAEGGSLSDFDRVSSLIQGHSYYKDVRGLSGKIIREISGLVGTAHISLAAIPNILQPGLLIPWVGVKRFVQTGNILFSLKRFRAAAEMGMKYGALERIDVATVYEKGFNVGSYHLWFRRLIGKVTTLRWQLHKNNVMSAYAANLLADDWAKRGILDKELEAAKNLDLSESEISGIQSGVLTEETRAKIIQNLVAKTQFLTEAQWKQGLLTQHPLGRYLLPYQSYASGQARRAIQLVDNFRKADSVDAYAQASRALIVTVVTYAGLGMVTKALREAITLSRKPERDDDLLRLIKSALGGEVEVRNLLNAAWDGMLNVQLFGPITRSLFRADRYDTTSEEMFVNLFPKIKAVIDGSAIVYNSFGQFYEKYLGDDWAYWGSYAKLPLKDRVLKHARRHFGLARTFVKWIDKIAYPQLEDYFLARRYQRKWDKEKPIVGGEWERREGSGGGVISPKYWEVRNAFKHLDIDEIELSVSKYYKKAFDLGGASELEVARSGLRASLMSGRPIKVKEEDLALFFRKVNAEHKEKVWKVYQRYMMLLNHFVPTKNR